ncbi:MAG TPA: ATP-binding protein [Candidatus Manganitrophaceae bacterium]|nr:ATP-binding protein [Candidatus Manganitrophaceae bacterium]
MKKELLKVSVGRRSRLIAVRDKIRAVLDYLEVPRLIQNRLIIALSELIRNTIQYAQEGTLLLSMEEGNGQWRIFFSLSDRGPGIARLNEIIQGAYPFAPGRGLGIASAKRLLDDFEIHSAAGEGTEVRGALRIPPLNGKLLEGPGLYQLREKLARQPDVEEMMATLRQQEEFIEQLNRELTLTNEGVVALYREIDEKNIELARVSHLKSAFMANMSHELRTPLNSILALSQILLDRIDGDLAPEQEKQVGMVQKSGEHLLQLINDILDFSRIEAGKVRIDKRWIDPGKLVHDVIKTIEPLAKKKGLELAVSAEEIPRLFSDEARIRQVLLNLLSNAVKFTHSGKIILALSVVKNDVEEVSFSVKDTGIGISEKELAYIFEPFHQVDSSASRKHGGTGLGLSICKQLVELMGGRIWAASAPRKGSTFTFVLPLGAGPKVES